MEEIKPKKERKFLKAMGDIALTLVRDLLLNVGKKVINKSGNKRQGLVIAFALVTGISYASIDSIPYPLTGNKQRLGWQTSGNGLVYRGRSNDTITKPSSYVDKNVKAYLLLDSVRGTIFVWRQTYWDSILVGGGGGTFAQPIDSLFFDTSVPTNNVETAKMRWDSDLATVVLGLNDNVPNELGFKNFWLVKNQTGSNITKGSLVYANGTVGSSGRITVDKFIANGSIDAKYLLGITAHDLTDGEDGYVISFGKIRQVNTDTFAAGAILYPSPTVAGVWTDIEPVAPNIDMPIGFCINSSANNGTIAIRVASGYKLSELHDVAISSPVEKASLYYSGGLWRDTTTALLVSDTAAMLANYSLKGYVDSIAQNFQDSIDEITNGYFKQEFPTVTKDTLNWTKPVQLPIGGSNLLLVYRNGQMINDVQYSVIDTNKVKINSGSYKLGENYTVVYVKGGGGSGSGGVPFDTSVLNLQARLDLKLNISDTAAMLANYATKAYADTTGRFYARQDFSNVSSSTLTWTQSDTLVTGGVNVIQVYRNGQILLPSQYTIPSSTSVVIAATSYKAGENYTVIFPRGGGAGSGGGSGSLTSISGGTGIIVSPDPITTTGTVSADLSVLMELTDTSLLNLTSRFNTKLNISDTAAMLANYNTRINSKLNISDTASMLTPYFRDADTTSLNLTSRFALKLNAADTASLSNRIDEKGTGTVTNIATGYGLTGGTITSTGTLLLDSAVVFSRIRDSIVDVAIGNDTIKILKQEYAPATTSVLTWTITPKFPIQSKSFILVFRNGQLLINDQYNLTDTNKITIVSNSFKVGANYTVVTVSGIGSVGTGVFPNPIYPEAGIALSTGSTWGLSIPNNSTNWNTAFTDRLKWDGGSTGLTPSTGRTSLGGTTIGQNMFTLTNPSAITFPRFNADNTVTALSAATFRSAIGSGTVTEVDASATAGNPISITDKTTTPKIELLSATSGRNGYLTSTDWTTFNGKQNALSNASSTVSGILTSTDWTTFNGKQNALSNASSTVSGILTSTDWTTFNGKQNAISLTTTGTSGVASFDGTTLNIPNYTSSGGGAGTVTSVGLTAPSIFNVGGSPVTTSGTLALTYSGTALPLLNGGTGATTADGALTNFGATAVGKSLFGLTNSVSDKFIKVNSNNTITLLNAADTRTAIGAGTGTVTSVTSGSTAISVATGTTTPVITIADASVANPGVMTTNAQGFIGDKQFYSPVTFWDIAFFKNYNYQATRLAGLSSTDRFSTVTLGSGLSLSGGVLSATSGGVTSVTASTPLSSSGGATPNITITDAGTGASGVVNTTTQSFAGNKTFTGNVDISTGTLNVGSTGTFGGRVKTNWLERNYAYSTSSSFTVSVNTTWQDINTNVLTTITLPNAATYPGKEIHLRQSGTGSIISFSSNVIPFTSPPTGSAGTAILNPTNNKAVTLVSDGTNWIIMQRSGN